MEENIQIEDRIIEAAKTVFVRKGYESAKMGDIAQEAGISRASLHYYFRNKETLFKGILEQVLNALLPNLEGIFDQEGSLLDKLPAIIHSYNDIVKKNQQLPLFIINELNRNQEHLYSIIAQEPWRIAAVLKFRQTILDEMEKGYIKKMPLIHVISTLIGSLVFPLLVKKPFTDAILDGDEKAFEEFLAERETLITGIMRNLLTP